ncbi:pyrroloquinoline quinone biosynthesis peptide chaperone PqqD [Paracoccus suum]|uniref:Pyrroloquinoline quinone biosynthesis peptide chaperone PqqD n=1 Tax=Paracoccus suum TaxID=2259340 RepID=A0A344PLR2_9RHOB|nr:pyrroloquinoline quinone biosynthesis peptide chaperone PqqD [Paracoccus suum]AXC50317.1 pyrroloquinoline quinone biosynthesis peptide chaperone PqqD [Paracoccus suum]
MTDAQTLKLDPHAVPWLPRGVRLAEDKVRGMRVLLGPERAMQLDEVGDAILTSLDGRRSVAQIAGDLGARFGAPPAEVLPDVSEFLSGLIERRLVFTTPDKPWT